MASFARSFLLVWGLCSLALAAGNRGVLVRVPQKATVVGPQIQLGQVAELIGDDKALLERLRRLPLGRAAAAGQTLRLTRGYIKIALRREGYPLEDVAFEGAETEDVLTKSRDLSASDLVPDVRSFVLGQLNESPENVEVKLAGPDKKVTVPAGALKVRFRAPLSGKYEGTLLLTGELEVDGKLVKVLPLRVVVEVYHRVVVAKKNLEKGDKLTEGNVGLERKPSSAILNGSIGSLSSVLGRTAGAPVGAGGILRMTEIYDPPVVKRGSEVQAIIRRGNIEITVKARAVEDGKAGDVIRIENTDSRKLLRGRVLDERTVLIERDKS